MKFITTLAATAALTLGAQAALADTMGCDDGEIVIKFSHVTNTDRHPKGIAASLLQSRVNEEMNGKACMEVFPNSTLYTDEQVIEAMLQGDVQLAAPSLSLFESITKSYRLFDLPFMFKNIEAVDAFQASEAGETMKASMTRRGLLGLEFWHNGMKQISANKPLLLPTDAAGLKFRVQPSDVLVAQMNALGAIAQPMAFAEVYGALQTGVVDGQENTWSNIYGQKFFEVQDGITETNHGIIDYLVVTVVDWLGRPARRRPCATVPDQIIKEVTETRNAESTKVNEEAKAAIIAAGGVVRELTPEQRQAWVDVMKPVWAQFEDEVGAGKHRRRSGDQRLDVSGYRWKSRQARSMIPGWAHENRNDRQGRGPRCSGIRNTSRRSAFGQAIHHLEETPSRIMLGLMTMITFVNVVFALSVSTRSVIWGLEVVLILFAWLVLFGISYGFKVTAHLGVDAVTNLLSPTTRRILGLISGVICIFYAMLLLKGAWDYWAPFAALQETTGRWFPTGFNEATRDRAFFETDQVPMLSWLRWLEDAINQGESYSKLPRVVPYTASTHRLRF